ncbi:hypothetical protein HYX16_04690 [Candidatus Woesearchaeota archaeon]|nr:hypothetical protein [Candidatus Woesearchaeota archaeon]
MVFPNMYLFWSLFIVFGIWSAIWKGVALWKSARNNQRSWFVFLFILNTLGILEIVYLAFFQKKKR